MGTQGGDGGRWLLHQAQRTGPPRRRIPQEWSVSYGALKAAAWPGSTVATRSGHTLYVKSVNGRQVEGVLTTEDFPGHGQVGIVHADEIIAVHDDGETRGAA